MHITLMQRMFSAHTNKPQDATSGTVSTAFMHCHVECEGRGADILLLHGTGASAHSFSGMNRILKAGFALTTIDLPGHGRSSPLDGLSPNIENVARAIGTLMNEMQIRPRYVIGHSAGAAIAAEMIHKKYIDPDILFSLNGAFDPFPGFAGQVFPAMAKLLFLNPFMPGLFAASATSEKVKRLIASTGSKISAEQLESYCRLFSDSTHVRGTLSMMANWDLADMQRKLSLLDCRVSLLVGDNDGTIDPASSARTVRGLKHGTREVLEGLGHLMHEEMPEQVAAIICRQITEYDKSIGQSS